MSIKKGDERIICDSGEKVTITHVSKLSIGWSEKGKVTTTHTSRNYFLEISRKAPVKANTQLKTKIMKTMKSIGGIGTFNKIIGAIKIRSKNRVNEKSIRNVLNFLVESGQIHYFERSDTYMANGAQA